MATIKDLKIMCKEHHFCIGCPIFYLDGCMLYRLPSNLDDIVDKWVEEHPLKEHPLKTYAHDFLKKFPNAQLDSYGAPRACVNAIYGLGDCSKSEISGIICRDCWNQKMKD